MRASMAAFGAAALFIATPAAAQDNAADTTDNAVVATEPLPEATTTDPAAATTTADPMVTAEPTVDTAPVATYQEERSGGFPWGLIGLVGLVGLLGRSRGS